MNLEISRRGATGLVLALALAALIFVYLMGRFGGPSPRLSDPYSVSATVRDAQGLSTKSDVLVRGVKVGEVQRIEVSGDGSEIEFLVKDRYAPLRRDARIRIGQKTLLGESYVDLDPGSRAAPALTSGQAIAAGNVRDGVELDEALAAFDEREALRSMLDTFGRGARPPQTAQRVNDTLGRLDELTGEMRRLTRTLRGQESTIAASVHDGRTVLGTLAARQDGLSSLVSSARATLAALAGREAALSEGLHELPRLLGAARRTLADAKPLLAEARPLVRDLREVGPSLTPALEDLRPVARDARRVLTGLPSLTAAAVPTLDRASAVIARARPVARLLDPALANLVPMLRYLSPRANTLAAWFSNTAGLGNHGDAKGSWARFFIFMEPGTAFGTPGSFSNNAYTPPGDAAHNAPHATGGYPRQEAFRP